MYAGAKPVFHSGADLNSKARFGGLFRREVPVSFMAHQMRLIIYYDIAGEPPQLLTSKIAPNLLIGREYSHLKHAEHPAPKVIGILKWATSQQERQP